MKYNFKEDMKDIFIGAGYGVALAISVILVLWALGVLK